MRDMDSLADRYLDARNARRAARDDLFVTLGRFIERYGDVGRTIVAVTDMIESCSTADRKPLVKAFASTDYKVEAVSRFGREVAEARMPKRRKKANGIQPAV